MHRREMFSAEIWNHIESQWGREIKKGCSRWWELQSRRLSYHQLIEWNPPTSFPSWVFSQSMLGSNLVVWNHKNSMWKIPCSWHAVVRNFMYRSLCSKALHSDKACLSQMSQLSPTDDPTGVCPCRVVNTSISFTHLGSCCSPLREQACTTGWVLLSGQRAPHEGRLWWVCWEVAPVECLCCEATPVFMAPHGIASLAFSTSRGTQRCRVIILT